MGRTKWRFAKDMTDVEYTSPLPGHMPVRHKDGKTKNQIVGDTIPLSSILGAAATPLDNSNAIQEGIDAANLRGGGRVHIDKPGTYYLASVTQHPYEPTKRNCLLPKSNVNLHLGKGVRVLLNNGEMVGDTQSVDLITFRNIINFSITGEGPNESIFDGNIAGQPGWTGGGTPYKQGSVAGSAINGLGTINSGNNNILVEGIGFENFFSCPVNIGGYLDRSTKNIVLRTLMSTDCGEGFQVHSTTNVTFEDLQVIDHGVCVGDGLEPSSCTNVWVDDCYLWQSGTNGGAGIDFGGSKNVYVARVTFDKWGSCFGIGADSFGGMTTDTIVRDCIVIDPAKGQVIGNGTGNGENNIFDGIDINCTNNQAAAFIANLTSTAAMPQLILRNIKSKYSKGYRIQGGVRARLVNIVIDSPTQPGINLVRSTAENPDIECFNVEVKNGLSYGLQSDGAGSAFTPTGKLINCSFKNNALGTINAVNSGVVTSLEFKGTSPSTAPPPSLGGTQNVAGLETLALSGGIHTLTGGYDGQTLKMDFREEDLVIPDFSISGIGNIFLRSNDPTVSFAKHSTLRVRRQADIDKWIEEGRVEFTPATPSTLSRAFNGTTQYFSSIVNATNLGFSLGTTSGGYLIWVYENSTATTQAYISYGNTSNWVLSGTAGNISYSYRDFNNVSQLLLVPARPVAGTWTQIYIDHEFGVGVSVKVNNNAPVFQACTVGLKAANDPRTLLLGAATTASSFLNGRLGIFLVPNRRLTMGVGGEVDLLWAAKPRIFNDAAAIIGATSFRCFNPLNEISGDSFDHSYNNIKLTNVGGVTSAAGPV